MSQKINPPTIGELIDSIDDPFCGKIIHLFDVYQKYKHLSTNLMSYLIFEFSHPAPSSTCTGALLNFTDIESIDRNSKITYRIRGRYLWLTTDGSNKWSNDIEITNFDNPNGEFNRDDVFTTGKGTVGIVMDLSEIPIYPPWLQPINQEVLTKLVYRTIGKVRFITSTMKLEPGDEIVKF